MSQTGAPGLIAIDSAGDETVTTRKAKVKTRSLGNRFVRHPRASSAGSGGPNGSGTLRSVGRRKQDGVRKSYEPAAPSTVNRLWKTYHKNSLPFAFCLLTMQEAESSPLA